MGSRVRSLALSTLIIAIGAAMAPLPALAQTCVHCNYNSFEACVDRCDFHYRNPPWTGTLIQPGYDDCYICCETSCGEGGGDEGDDNDTGGSPIVLDLDAGTVTFTSAADGVLFDIDGDGVRDPIAWTDPNGGTGFLALDRNGNGTIDSGLELFGNYTDQPSSSRPNGFVALAVFDRADRGGNGDGVISYLDGVGSALRIWIDRNHNGRSEATELYRLDEFEIAAIDLRYFQTRRRDQYGNELRYRSRVERHGPPTHAIDVFFRRVQ